MDQETELPLDEMDADEEAEDDQALGDAMSGSYCALTGSASVRS